MSDKEKAYNPAEIEKKWAAFWEERGIYQTDLKGAKKPFYNLMMYPYPSAEGLHVGNVYAFTGADIYGRFRAMRGWDVFEPIGFDSGGIHSENYAIKVGVNPKIQIPANVRHFRDQLHRIGARYDWKHTVDAMDPSYYRWTQWLFIQFFKAGLAYKKKASVTYCPNCKTTLADEQTERKSQNSNLKIQNCNAKLKTNKNKNKITEEITVCERCKTPVVKKKLEQWFFRITAYAERLLQNTYNKLKWPEKILLAQRNWIGKKEGAEIKFSIFNFQFSISVFTTRPDTLWGCTFICLAPESEYMSYIMRYASCGKKKEIEKYIKLAKNKLEMDRRAEDKEKTGVFTGLYALNPVNKEKLPIYVADYVLTDYGSGAVMGVPGHDQRDWDFAKKYGLTIKTVVRPEEKVKSQKSKLNKDNCYEGDGILVNSGSWTGWKYPRDIKKIIDWLEKRKIGKKSVQYKLRDWCISRQRYWGPPIPMIFCPHCASQGKNWYDTKEAKEYLAKIKSQNLKVKNKNSKFKIENSSSAGGAGWYPVSEEQLPVLLPDTDDYLPDEAGGKPPLARIESFVETTCPVCGKSARRETDVSDTFLDSSWYFLAYPNTVSEEYEKGTQSPFNKFLTKKWLPVSQYTGGAEHSVLHLLYSRFITMALHDLGYLDFEEPFPKFYAHGLIIKDGAKMSKSRGNIVNPDEYIEKYGADSLRAYLMFLGPFWAGGDFRDTGMIGMYRFVKKLYQLAIRSARNQRIDLSDRLNRELNKTVKKIGEDYPKFKFNTAIASLMSFCKVWQEEMENSNIEVSKTIALLIAPLMPYLAEEIWSIASDKQKALNNKQEILSVHLQSWPKYDPHLVKDEQATIIIQVNGKIRDKIIVGLGQNAPDKKEIIKMVNKSEKVKKYLQGKSIRKTIYVPGKLVNLVV